MADLFDAELEALRERLRQLGYREWELVPTDGPRWWWVPPEQGAYRVTEEEALSRLEAKP